MEQVKRYLALIGATFNLGKDDLLIEESIDRATRIIEEATHRAFE